MASLCWLLLVTILGNGCGYTVVQRSEHPNQLHRNYNRFQHRNVPAPSSVHSWEPPLILSKESCQSLLELYYLIRAISVYRRPHVAHQNDLDKFIQELQDDDLQTRLRRILRNYDGFEDVSTLGMYNDGQSLLELLQKEYYVNDYRLLIPMIHRVLNAIKLDEIGSEYAIHEKLALLKDHVKKLTVNVVQKEEELYRSIAGPKVDERDSWTVEDVLAGIFQKQEGDTLTEFNDKYDIVDEDDKPLDSGTVEEFWVILDYPEQDGEQEEPLKNLMKPNGEESIAQPPSPTNEAVLEPLLQFPEVFPSLEETESQGIEEPELDYFNKHYGVSQTSSEVPIELEESVNPTPEDRSDNEELASPDYGMTEDVMPEVFPDSVECTVEPELDSPTIKDEDAIIFPVQESKEYVSANTIISETSGEVLNLTLPIGMTLKSNTSETSDDTNFVFESEKLIIPINVSDPADLVEPKQHTTVDDNVKQTEALSTVQSIPLWLLKGGSSEVGEDASLRELEEDETNKLQSSVSAEPEKWEEPSEILLEVDPDVLLDMKNELVEILNQLVEREGFVNLRKSITDEDVNRLVDQMDQDEMMKLVGGDDINRPELISLLQEMVMYKGLENGDKIVEALELMKNGESVDVDDGYFETNYGVGQGVEDKVEGRALNEDGVDKEPLKEEGDQEGETIEEQGNEDEGESEGDYDDVNLAQGATEIADKISNDFEADEAQNTESSIPLEPFPEQVLPEWVSADNSVESFDSKIPQNNADTLRENPKKTNDTGAAEVFPYNSTVVSREEQQDPLNQTDELPSKIFPSNVGTTKNDFESHTPRNDISKTTLDDSENPKRQFIQPFPATVPTETKPVEVGRTSDEENILSERSKYILAD